VAIARQGNATVVAEAILAQPMNGGLIRGHGL
jgi:hypothetical protein